VADEALDAIYRQYAGAGQTGRDIVVGPVGRNAVVGRRVPNKRLPGQYKFEGGAAALAFDGMIPCQETER
jgi:hypothetical protein